MIRAHHHPPRDCPVCGQRLVTSRLSCDGCETELTGWFEPCDFCALDADQRQLLRVFLASRGNLKDLERHLGVSYPTARARFAEVLAALGLATEDESGDQRLVTLAALAEGQIDVDEASRRLER